MIPQTRALRFVASIAISCSGLIITLPSAAQHFARRVISPPLIEGRMRNAG